MRPELLKRLAAPVPRYTSYPTANHFSDAIQSTDHAAWLSALPEDTQLSLYLHFPFCHTMCWYCACNTRAVRRYEPITEYLLAIEQEIDQVAKRLPRHAVSHIHFGGGSPDILKAEDIRRIGAKLRSRFTILPSAEIAVEIDPRLLDESQVGAFCEIGVNRISLGVQDFDPKVQAAIGREQSFAVTRDAVESFRQCGVSSINIDLVYGLPHQTVETAKSTIEDVISLSPERVAIFGYAHLPQRIKSQRLIDSAALPGPEARLELSRTLAQTLVAAGYRQIGIDHFAKSSDSIATKPISRNFQGYTTDSADTLIGIGASAISKFPQGFVQNAVAAADYQRRIENIGLASARGIAFSPEDRVRAFVIERLMCDFTFTEAEIASKFGECPKPLVETAKAICANDEDGLVEPTPTGFRLTETGRPFVRNICARFDTYLGTSEARHSQGV